MINLILTSLKLRLAPGIMREKTFFQLKIHPQPKAAILEVKISSTLTVAMGISYFLQRG